MDTLAGLLGYIDRQVSPAKRKLADLLRNPVESGQQMIGGLLDDTRRLDSMYKTAGDGYRLDAQGSVMGGLPQYKQAQQQQLAGLLNTLPVGSINKAHTVAQKNAALPIEQGGLGLPPNNTAMDRAKAMGFDAPAYHGTGNDIQAFDLALADSRRKTGTPRAAVVSSNPSTASTYANQATDSYGNISGYGDGGNVLPLLINRGNSMTVNGRGENWASLYDRRFPDAESTNDIAEIALQKGKDSAVIKKVLDNATWSKQQTNKGLKDFRVGDTTFVFDPSNIRSRFAAFDPFRRNSADLLAGGLPFMYLGKDEQK